MVEEFAKPAPAAFKENKDEACSSSSFAASDNAPTPDADQENQTPPSPNPNEAGSEARKQYLQVPQILLHKNVVDANLLELLAASQKAILQMCEIKVPLAKLKEGNIRTLCMESCMLAGAETEESFQKLEQLTLIRQEQVALQKPLNLKTLELVQMTVNDTTILQNVSESLVLLQCSFNDTKAIVDIDTPRFIVDVVGGGNTYTEVGKKTSTTLHLLGKSNYVFEPNSTYPSVKELGVSKLSILQDQFETRFPNVQVVRFFTDKYSDDFITFFKKQDQVKNIFMYVQNSVFEFAK